MKKIYNQPTVSTVNLLGGSMLMDSSPASTLPIVPTPIPGEGD